MCTKCEVSMSYRVLGGKCAQMPMPVPQDDNNAQSMAV